MSETPELTAAALPATPPPPSTDATEGKAAIARITGAMAAEASASEAAAFMDDEDVGGVDGLEPPSAPPAPGPGTPQGGASTTVAAAMPGGHAEAAAAVVSMYEILVTMICGAIAGIDSDHFKFAKSARIAATKSLAKWFEQIRFSTNMTAIFAILALVACTIPAVSLAIRTRKARKRQEASQQHYAAFEPAPVNTGDPSIDAAFSAAAKVRREESAAEGFEETDEVNVFALSDYEKKAVNFDIDSDGFYTKKGTTYRKNAEKTEKASAEIRRLYDQGMNSRQVKQIVQKALSGDKK
jgi:hypothetical protein